MNEVKPTPVEVVGTQGLATSLEAASQQIASLEKQVAHQFGALSLDITAANAAGEVRAEHLHEILDLHIHYRDKLIDQQTKNHDALHAQEHEAVRVALQTLDNRLAGFPKEFASLAVVGDLGDRLTRFEHDTRIRFEQADQRAVEANITLERRLVEGLALIDKRLTEGLLLAGTETRTAARPGQDIKTIVGAIGGLLLLAVAVIGVIVAVANAVS